MGLASIQMDRNPFNSMTMNNFGIIPGPISFRCDNIQFIESWIKYIFQSAICVICHTFTFFITILWIRFIFSSYYDYEFENRNNNNNNIKSYKLSILSYLPFSSWIWIIICLTNIIFFLGFMIQTWVIPIQWNFEDNSNTKLFRYFGIFFILIIIILNILFSLLQIFSYSIFYNILNISQLIITLLFSFILLFVILKNGRNSNSLTNDNNIDENNNNDNNDNNNNNDDENKMDLSSENIDIFQKIQKKSKKNIIMVLSKDYSCSKLLLICSIFSLIITFALCSLFINFNYLLPFLLNNNNNNNDNDDSLFNKKFIIQIISILFGTLLIGNLLILFMRILMRWLTILLSSSDSYDIHLSFNANYGTMQTFNRMILFIIPLLFIVKLSLSLMFYTFINLNQFIIAIIIFCIFSRCFNKIFKNIENKILYKLLKNDNNDDDNVDNNLQDHHLLAQCNYINDIIHYITILLIPLIFALFRINLKNQDYNFVELYYIKRVIIQFLIESLFDIFPLFIILFGNPFSSRNSKKGYNSFYHLSYINQIKPNNLNISIKLKIEYINMMNGWTATDKCVKHFMWWSTIFIAGYFTFYLLYPQQFFCVIKSNTNNLFLNHWIYVQCD